MNQSSDTITKLIGALIAAQGEFAPAVKRKTNPAFRSKYVDLEGVLDAVTPALLAHRIALVQQPDLIDGVLVLVTRLIHESGEWLGCTYPINPVKHDPQGEGSALTYARRYSAMTLCGIAPEDDDGNAASQRPVERSTPRQYPVTPAASEEPFEDPAELLALIGAAVSPTQLAEVGKAIAESPLSPDGRSQLKAAYSARMRELKTGPA